MPKARKASGEFCFPDHQLFVAFSTECRFQHQYHLCSVISGTEAKRMIAICGTLVLFHPWLWFRWLLWFIMTELTGTALKKIWSIWGLFYTSTFKRFEYYELASTLPFHLNLNVHSFLQRYLIFENFFNIWLSHHLIFDHQCFEY